MKLLLQKSILGILCLLFTPFLSLSQYPPQAGNIGTSAIHRDSSIIKSFENFYPGSEGKEIVRGWQSSADTTIGKASVGSLDTIFSPLGQRPFLISLGDGGKLTFELPYPIYDGTGPDFVVFENGFPFSKDSFFLELAFVEVSTDGIKYFRFPAFSETDTLQQVGAFGSLKAEKIHNLAGKYIMPFGVPFDLKDLKDSLEIPGKTTEIRFIRFVDVVGSINPDYASRDALGRIINDPWPTPFPSGGFDLSGIGFIHVLGLSNSKELKLGESSIVVFPNPLTDKSILNLQCEFRMDDLKIFDINGQLKINLTELNQNNLEVNLNELGSGVYYLKIRNGNHFSNAIKIIKL